MVNICLKDPKMSRNAMAAKQFKLSFGDVKAIDYDHGNPLVWEYFVLFTFEMIEKGYKRIGSKMIFERIRWETMIKGDPFKVNNNYTPYYARKFEREYPQHKGIFSKRVAITD